MMSSPYACADYIINSGKTFKKVCLINVRSKQLWSYRDGQLS